MALDSTTVLRLKNRPQPTTTSTRPSAICTSSTIPTRATPRASRSVAARPSIVVSTSRRHTHSRGLSRSTTVVQALLSQIIITTTHTKTPTSLNLDSPPTTFLTASQPRPHTLRNMQDIGNQLFRSSTPAYRAMHTASIIMATSTAKAPTKTT